MVGLLIPLYDRIDAILVRYGSFNSTQKFRLLVGDYYMKCDGHANYRFPNGYINNIIHETSCSDRLHRKKKISPKGMEP